jgi:hypothetical protein
MRLESKNLYVNLPIKTTAYLITITAHTLLIEIVLEYRLFNLFSFLK